MLYKSGLVMNKCCLTVSVFSSVLSIGQCCLCVNVLYVLMHFQLKNPFVPPHKTGHSHMMLLVETNDMDTSFWCNVTPPGSVSLC